MSQSTVIALANTPAANGGSWSPHTVWDSVNSLWWTFAILAASTTTLRSYSSPDGVTWTARATKTIVAVTDGRNLAIAYQAISGAAVFHINYTHGVATSHVRAKAVGVTLTISTIVTDGSTTGVVTPAGNSAAIDSGSTPMDGIGGGQTGDFAVGGATSSDSGSSWATGFGTVVNVEAGTNNISSSTLIPLSTGYVLGICDNGGGVTPPVTLTNLNAGKLLNFRSAITHTTSGSWTALFTTLGAAQNANTWSAAYISDADVHCVLASSTNAFTHKRINASGASLTAPTVSAGSTIGNQTFNASGGACLIYDGTTLWLFAIDSASGNDVVVNSWTSGGGWAGWNNVGLASATRNYLSAAWDGGTSIQLTWVEGSGSSFSLCSINYATVAIVDTFPAGYSHQQMIVFRQDMS